MESSLTLGSRVTTTIARELLVAVTGLILITFILGHLGGNFLIFFGPDALNSYAEHLHSLGPLLWLMRIGMIMAFALHVATAVQLDLANRQSRGTKYAVRTYAGRKTWATRVMIFSGIIIAFFVFIHLRDFSLASKSGEMTVVEGMHNNRSLGLYGLVWNSFANPLRCAFYFLAVWAVGFHLSHALSSILVTFGILSDKGTARADYLARIVGMLVALGYSAIPAYVLIKTYIVGVG